MEIYQSPKIDVNPVRSNPAKRDAVPLKAERTSNGVNPSRGFRWDSRKARDKIKSSFPRLKSSFKKFFRNRALWSLVLIIIVSSSFGFMGGSLSNGYLKNYLERFNITTNKQEISQGYVPQTSQEEAIIKAVKLVSPAVVSIIISKEVPIYEQYYVNPFQQFKDFFGPLPPDFLIPKLRQKGTQLQEIGGGTGLIISQNGLVLTNKHVVSNAKAEYTVFTNDGKKYPAKVLALDPVQDLALIKITVDNSLNQQGQFSPNSFPTAQLGNSDNIQIGQSVIAIGNALGEFRNTVSVGVISGSGRTVTASGGGVAETLSNVIQTDAAINKGNSGGPLLNLKGEVIGLNTAIATDAQSIGFAIPINQAKRDIQQIESAGKISYPFLGVRYILVNEQVKKDNNLMVDYGALVKKGDKGEAAVIAGSSAEKAGIKEGDIILEFNGEKITQDNFLIKLIAKYNVNDKVSLKILRAGKIITLEATLSERAQ